MLSEANVNIFAHKIQAKVLDTHQRGDAVIGIKSLRTKKSRDELGVFVVEGEKFVNEIPEGFMVVQYIVSDDYRKPTDILKSRAQVLEVTRTVFNRVADTAAPQGILAVVKKKICSFEDTKDGFMLVCENINDPGNLGTLIRTAAAAEASCVVLTHGSVSVWNPKVQRASAGLALRLPIISDAGIDDIADYTNKHGIPLYAAHQEGNSLPYELDLSDKFCLILGSESHGLSKTARSKAAALLKLPMSDNVESLSVAVAGSIIMYEAMRQKIAISLPEV